MVIKLIPLAVIAVIFMLEPDIPELPDRGTRRLRVHLVNTLSRPPLQLGGGLFGRSVRWLDNQEVPGRLTVDPDRDHFLWEAEEHDRRSAPIAVVYERLATVEVAERWRYRFGRRTVVVVSLASGAELWLTGPSSNVALQRLR